MMTIIFAKFPFQTSAATDATDASTVMVAASKEEEEEEEVAFMVDCCLLFSLLVISLVSFYCHRVCVCMCRLLCVVCLCCLSYQQMPSKMPSKNLYQHLPAYSCARNAEI